MLLTDVKPSVYSANPSELRLTHSIFGVNNTVEKMQTNSNQEDQDDSNNDSNEETKTDNNCKKPGIIYSILFFLLMFAGLSVDITSRFSNYNKYLLYLIISLCLTLLFLLFTKVY